MTLEDLLNTLIQRGRKPFGKKYESVCKEHNKWHSYMFDYDVYYIREITSKESLLWQFVCENRKQGYTMPQGWIKNPKICDEGIESVEKECNQNSYEYYIIESSLKDESDLEQFLLDNIKI